MSGRAYPGYHVNVVVSCDPAEVEYASDELWAMGATAVEERSAGQVVELWTSLGEDVELIESLLGGSSRSWRLERVDARVTDTWRQFVEAVIVDDGLTIAPAWLDPVPANGGIVVRVARCDIRPWEPPHYRRLRPDAA